MTDTMVTLTNCDIEPIHIPGKIQGHGFLIAVDNKTFEVNFISENFSDLITEGAVSLLGKNLTFVEEKLNLTGSYSNFKFAQIIQAFNNGNSVNFLNPFYIEINNTAFNLIISLSGNELILEFEPSDNNLEFTIQQTIGKSISGILSGKNLLSLFENAASEIKNLINYDRIMIYRFNEDGHGEVIAEAKNKTLEPFIGLHYPASDIPKQARELYKINLTRIIADVHIESVPVITKKNKAVLNLTEASLRAVSPIHIQYLKNMGVASSFSISLISHGELWGLIACHNYTPKFINYKIREASKLIGQILSSALEYRLGEEDAEQFNLLNQSVNELVKYLERENYIVNALTANSTTINNVTKATGAILVFDNIITSVGITPDKEQAGEIIKWLKTNMNETIYHTNSFAEIFLPAKKYSEFASGILVCMISKEPSEFIIWFKPEQVAELNWAGNPEKPTEKNEFGLLLISPRESFASWKQIVKDTSEKWNRSEIAAAVAIREHIIYAKNRKENEIRLLNERLKIIYEQQDTFNFTISHDLKTPLSSIKGYSELLLKNNNSLDDNAKNILERIQLCADKMALLIKEIFNYSKIGRAGIELRQINMAALISEIKKDLTEAFQPLNLQFIIGETPDINGDQVMIQQVFSNLINNAIKYSSGSNPSIVKVEGKISEGRIIYSVSDNGIGIETKDQSQVFELFKRMDNAMDFEGTGIGLAIVKRIIEKHNATISLESVVGDGTTFYLSFKNYQ